MKLIFCALLILSTMDIQNRPAPDVKPQKQYAGDQWERERAIYGNGYLDTAKYSGDMLKDFADYLHIQGGRKSADPHDSICFKTVRGVRVPNPAAWPELPDKDGKKWHTVDDITYILYCRLAPVLGYTASPADFYASNQRLKIVAWHIEQGKFCKSDLCNLVGAYMVWGSGSYKSTVQRFNQYWGDVNAHIDRNGEYLTFWRLLYCRLLVMRDRNPNDWPRYGVGWSSGLAHFHRVFKHYAKN